ncbi:hypothetical protein K491DRAFT_586967 [Lophiostoma macrostomum CBS 122681]|uniref:Microbial-type PARG catalytic domain-containing protein n=1 Tax=Lophiostoma macrostomum CBS 122681 TaxID=1314788 RepID=A0A6A6TRN2_9PLEO|nr:hypothetical protein K491DRAFT_586967 [Lophiostoma macrostomum CBS 122681]
MSASAVKRRNDLRAIAAETQAILPDILAQVPSLDTTVSSVHPLKQLEFLDPAQCPGFQLSESDPEAGRKGTRIRVYDQDTFDVALDLQPGTTVSSLPHSSLTIAEPEPSHLDDGANQDEVDAAPSRSSDSATPDSNTSPIPTVTSLKPVVVLNLASDKHPGGGWLNGALAQEEALCYRSSLSLSLHSSYYPIPSLSGLYSPSVLLIRDAIVITVAALRRPPINHSGLERATFANPRDREATKSKIRLTLRLACHRDHTKIVLGALGCGAFGNPPEEVAQCFKEVFAEDEFQGGWWEDVVFAVLDNRSGDKGGKAGDGNFGVFWRGLDGVVV